MNRGRYIYGRHPVSEALKGKPRDVQRLYVAGAGHTTKLSDLEQLAQRHGIPIVMVPKRKLDELVGPVPHQGVVAAVTPFNYVDLAELLRPASERDEAPLLLGLDSVQDPHNLGALVRSAYALGAHGVFLPKDRAAEVNPTVVKAAAGATAHLPIARVTNMRSSLEELKQVGLWVVGAAVEGTELLTDVDLTGPTVLVVGSEGRGMRRLVAETCDRLVRIPMVGTLGSLNASVAGGVVLYEAMRQRAAAKRRGPASSG